MPPREELSKTHLFSILTLKMCTVDRKHFRSLSEFTSHAKSLLELFEKLFSGSMIKHYTYNKAYTPFSVHQRI